MQIPYFAASGSKRCKKEMGSLPPLLSGEKSERGRRLAAKCAVYGELRLEVASSSASASHSAHFSLNIAAAVRGMHNLGRLSYLCFDFETAH